MSEYNQALVARVERAERNANIVIASIMVLALVLGVALPG
jgi:hypothetical protein